MKNKKYLVPIVIVGIVLLLFLIITIYHHKTDFEKHYITNNQEKSIDLNELYDENAIAFESYQTTINGVDCFYVQLNGLKKAKVENNINKNIKNKLNELTTNQEVSSYSEIYVQQKGNFGNILSLLFYTVIEDNTIILDTLNYNLVNGEKITLEQLFTSSTSIPTVIEETLNNYLDQTTLDDCKISEKDNESDESSYCISQSETVENYLQLLTNSDFQFYFDQFAVYVIFDDLKLEIAYAKYPEYFSLHYRYLTTVSIYKNDKIGKKDVLIASYRDNGVYSILDKTSENVYADVVIQSDEDALSEEVLESIDILVDEEITRISNLYNENFLFLNQSGQLTKMDDTYIDPDNKENINKNRFNLYILTVDTTLYEVEEDYFGEQLKEDVYRLHREESSSNNFIAISEYLHKETISKKWILLANGNTLDNIDDLFVEDYDYKTIIKNVIVQKYKLNEETAISLLENATYHYQLKTENIDTSYCIVVTDQTNKNYYISFEEFDKNAMYVYAAEK